MAVYAKQVFEDGQTLHASDLNAIASGIVDANINNYVHALPSSQSMANVIKRAHQLTDVLWTARGVIPGKFKRNGVYEDYDFQEGVTYKGCPYEGGVISTYTYVGLNVDLDTFIGAVQNPNSILYNYDSNHQKGGAYYGTVCSKFAQYALDIPASYNTNSIPYIEGLDTIAQAAEYTPYDVKLCDILVNTASHTVICTDLLYDSYGNLVFIEISEAVTPLCRRLLWHVDEFYDRWIKTYRLCRYQHIDNIPYEKKDYVNVRDEFKEIKILDYALMPEYGNKCNYTVTATKGKCHILKKGFSKAVVKLNDEIIDTISINDSSTSFSFDRSKIGYLEMYLEDDNGNKSESVYGCVVQATVSIINSSKYNKGELEISYTGSSGKPCYIQFGSGQTEFCRLDGKGRSTILSDTSAIIKFTASRASQNIRVAYKNEYGTYYSPIVSFEIQDANVSTNISTNNYLSRGNYYKDFALTSTNSTPIATTGKHTYTNVPVEFNTEYNISGASLVWFFSSSDESLSYIVPTSNSIITPPLTAFINITFDGSEDNGTDAITRISATDSDNDIALSATGATLKDNMNLDSTSYTTISNNDYFTFLEIPVTAGNTYYSRGATRSWYLDSSKNPVKTINLKNSTDVPYVFEVPSGVSYVSIAYSRKAKAEKDMVYIRKIDDVTGLIDCA